MPKFGTMLEKPFFVQTQSEEMDELFGSIEEAIAYGQDNQLAPFVVMQLLAQPVRSIIMNRKPREPKLPPAA